MKNILVIGNGFDIAHGLDTKYEDFYKFCKSIKQSNYLENDVRSKIKARMLQNDLKKSTANVITYKKTIDDKTLKKMIKICQDNYWLRCIAEHHLANDPRWCDIEGIIADEISMIEYVAERYKNSRVRPQAMNESLKVIDIYDHIMTDTPPIQSFQTSLDCFKKRLLSDLNKLTQILELYLSKFLNTKYKTYKFFETLPVDYIINFNYTNTYNKLYKRNIPTHFIHGKIRNSMRDNMNMVFGIGDKINNDDNNYDFIEFQKYYQRLIYRTGNDYAKWLEISGVVNIFIFGHSVNDVDGDIIKKLVTREQSPIYIYCFDEEAFHSIVANLARILGKDMLIDFTNQNKIKFMKVDLNISVYERNDMATFKEKQWINV